MHFHLVLVSWTWFPRGWWTLSFGRPQKALGKTAQVRPSLPLLWEESSSLGYGAGRGADGARPLAFSSWRFGGSVHSVLRQLPGPSHCDCRAHPDYLRPLRGSLPLLLCQTWGRGVGVLESFPSFLEVSVSPCLVDLKAKEERCNGIISLPRASKGTMKSLGKI